MKKWKIILVALLAVLVLEATPLAVMAQGQTDSESSAKRFSRVHLALVQPWAVRVGQEMQLTVFVRLNQEPAEGAGVWALPQEKIDSVKQAIKDLAVQGINNITGENFENLLNSNGTFLDRTDAHGKIFHTFTEAGNFVLVALKPGFLPGYSRLAVRDLMTVSAPKRAAPGETVTIKVNQKGTAEPVVGANIWVVDASNIKAVREKLGQIRITNRGNLQNVNWESELTNLAVKLGQTDENGKITDAFDQGKYLIVAVKQGSVPAYTGIAILEPSAVTPANSKLDTTLD